MEAFDLVFVAPPQYQDLWRKGASACGRPPEMLYEDGMVVVRIHPRRRAGGTEIAGRVRQARMDRCC
ncbi:MAG: hypothetical protein R2856_14665 [Caldilineaceae bacterium]